jgi:hypothetical protein
VQRAYDGKTKEDWPKDKMRKLWTKLRKRTGNANSPLPSSGDDFIETLIGRTNETERAMAEELIKLNAVRSLLMPERDRHADATAFETLKESTKGNSPKKTQKAARINAEAIIEAYLRQALYYHVTFVKHVAAIKQSGLQADRGGKGTGVSTHGRDDARSAEARETYNSWSRGYVFVTKSRGEADGYLAKLKEKEAVEGAAQILHVFVPPAMVDAKALIDADSTQEAIKLPADTPMIGDGATLNQATLTAIKDMLDWEFKIKVKPPRINAIYASKFAI